MATVVFPNELRRFAGGAERMEIPARSTRELLAELERRFPGFRARVARGTALAIDGGVTRIDEIAELAPDAEVCFVPQVGGG